MCAVILLWYTHGISVVIKKFRLVTIFGLMISCLLRGCICCYRDSVNTRTSVASTCPFGQQLPSLPISKIPLYKISLNTLEDLNPFCFSQQLPRPDRGRQFSGISYLFISNSQVRTCTIEDFLYFVVRFVYQLFYYNRIFTLIAFVQPSDSLISFIIALPGLNGIWLIAVSLMQSPGT